MSNRDALVLLGAAVVAFLLGGALGDRGDFLKGAAAIGAVLGGAVLLWNLFVSNRDSEKG